MEIERKNARGGRNFVDAGKGVGVGMGPGKEVGSTRRGLRENWPRPCSMCSQTLSALLVPDGSDREGEREERMIEKEVRRRECEIGKKNRDKPGSNVAKTEL